VLKKKKLRIKKIVRMIKVSKIKVDMTLEEVASYHKQKFLASSEDKCWFFKLIFSIPQLEELETEIKKKLDTRMYKTSRDAFSYVEHRIWSKMKIEPSKIGDFDVVSLKILPDVIVAFREKVCDLIGIVGYKPKQKTLDESK